MTAVFFGLYNYYSVNFSELSITLTLTNSKHRLLNNFTAFIEIYQMCRNIRKMQYSSF